MRLNILNKIVLIFLIVGAIILLFLFFPATPQGVSDNTPRTLATPVRTIKEGIHLASQRAHEWRSDLYLYYINAGFNGREQIKLQKGRISYYFYAKKAVRDLDALARVDIDMNTNRIVHFSSTFGTPRQLMGGAPLNTNKWVIDIKDIFDLAIQNLGENLLLEYDNPKFVLRCSEVSWDLAVYSKPKAPYADKTVKVNPKTGKVVRLDDRPYRKINKALLKHNLH